MGLIDRLRGREANQDATLGLIKVGGSTWSAKWSFTRTLDAVYANPTGKRCIERIASDFQRPPWQLRERGTANDLAYDDAPAAYDVLQRPMPGRMSGTQMQYLISRDLDLTGGTFWLKLRGGEDGLGDGGPVTGLRHLAPQRVTVIADDDDILIGFIYMNRRGERMLLYPEDVVYVHYPHPEVESDRMAPAIVAGLSADTDNASMKFNFTLLTNDSALPGYLVVDGMTTERFRQWKSEWDSGDSPGKTRFLNGQNARYVKIGQTNQELTYNELRKASKEDIIVSFGLTRVQIDPSDASFANLFNANKAYIKSLVDPRWTLVSDVFSMQLGDDLGGFDIGFNLDNIEELNEGTAQYIERMIPLLDRDVATPNEVRVELGWDPVPWGDSPLSEFRASVAVGQATALGELTAGAAGEQLDDAGTRGVAVIEAKAKRKATVSTDTEEYDRIVRRHENRAEKGLNRFFERQQNAIIARIRSKKSVNKAVDDWWDGERWKAEMAEFWLPVLSDGADSIGTLMLSQFDAAGDFDINSDRMASYLEGRSTEISTLINDTTADQVRAAIQSINDNGGGIAEIVEAIQGYFTGDDARAKSRATTCARTEIIGAAAAASIEAANQSGVVTGKEWLPASDAEQHCIDVASEGVIALDASFSGGVDHPPLHPNCRCTLTFTIAED